MFDVRSDNEWYPDDPDLSKEELGRRKLLFDLGQLRPRSEWIPDAQLMELYQELAG